MNSFILLLKKIRHSFYILLYKMYPINNNKIVFWADGFNSFGCNPKYICKHLMSNYQGLFDIVWVFENDIQIPLNFPKQARYVRFMTKEYLKEIYTAHFVVCNSRTGSSYHWKKRKNQKYIQTWHSSLRLKKIEGDAIDSLPSGYIDYAVADSNMIDILISGCKFSTNIFRNSFWYNGEILELGTPRSDVLIKKPKDIKNKVFDYYNIDKQKKIILYAPTFRNSKEAQLHGIDIIRIKDVLNKATGFEWEFCCRFHPNVKDTIEIDGCINMSKYSDMQELLVASSCLLTDYSSCMFDAAVSGIPCFLYTPDLENYLENERELYFDILNLPFGVSKNNDELYDLIEIFNYEEYKRKIDKFLKDVGSFEDGHASERICKWIVEEMNE